MDREPGSQVQVSPRTQVDELLVDLFDRYQDSFDKYQWPWEAQRWYELVYCVLSAVEGRFGPETRSASTVRVLMELGLLEIPTVAEAAATTRRDIRMVLERLGFSEEKANRLVRTLCVLAERLHETYEGKVQRLLRTVGTELADEVIKQLPLEEPLGTEKASLAVRHWLQNVLNLPILVASPGLQALLRETGAGIDDVLTAVDELDINVALLDEILNRWVEGHPYAEWAGEQREVV